MWSTIHEPDFVLPPKHALIFREAVCAVSDFVGWEDSDNDGWESGIAVFDRLTQGQKQLILLTVARALLQGAELIVLDESFASLDPQNLQRALRCVLERAPTLLVIAHP